MPNKPNITSLTIHQHVFRKYMDALDAGLSSDDDQSDQEDDVAAAAPPEKKPKIDVDILNKHGYGAPNVLLVPEKQDDAQNWAWSSGTEKKREETKHEDFDEREKNREAVTKGAEESAKFAEAAREQAQKLKEERYKERQAIKEKDLKWKEKEKRKRDAGQQSRGKNYVEEEKRKERELGMYSGFD
jgi:hypothetical protein